MPDSASRLRRLLSPAQGATLGWPDALRALLLAGALALWVTQAFPWIHFHELSQDEGYNMAKAALVHAGYRMYTDIWSDQPPVLTYVLSALQNVFPWSVLAGRLLVLGSAALLLGALYLLVARLHGRRAALWTAALLMTAPIFIRLSVSIMIGLPSVALAVVAMAVAVVPRWPLAVRMVLAGLLYALSLQTKFFTGLLAPAVLLAVVIGAESDDRCPWKPALAWFVAAAVAGLSIVALVAGEAFVSQLVQPHYATGVRGAYSLAGSVKLIVGVLSGHVALTVAGLLGAVVLVVGWRWRRDELLPLLWLVVPAVGLMMHTPVWNHQVLLMLVPLAWLGGLALDRATGALWSVEGRWGRAVAVGVGTIMLAFCGVQAWRAQGPEPHAKAKRALQEHIGRAPATGAWMVTDSPLDAFRAGFLVPPELAVYSAKRQKAGALTARQVMLAIDRWQPQQVAFRRVKPEPQLQAYLGQRFFKEFGHKHFSHWVPYPVRASGQEEALVSRRLEQLLDGFANTGMNGAFAGAVSVDGESRYGERTVELIGPASAFMRPPGSTPRVGSCYLDAYRATGEARYRETASLIGGAVMRAQSCNGAWLSATILERRCGPGDARTESGLTLDEGMVAQAIGFLIDLQVIEPPGPRRELLQASINRGLDFLVAAQNGHGAWPLAYSKTSYASHSTINDDLTTSHVRVLLRASEAYGVARYRKAALRGVDFLLRTQSQRGGWAQQYDDELRPAPARSFEPAALSSIETAQVMQTLLQARTQVDDPRLAAALERGRRWLSGSAIDVNRWARFYDLRANRPLYVDRSGVFYRSVDALPPERRDGYRWEGSFPEVIAAIELAQAANTGDQALASERKRLSLVRRLQNQREARSWLAAHATQEVVPLADEKGLIWSKDVIHRCGQLLSLLQ